MVRAHSRACAVSVTPGNRRRSSTATAQSFYVEVRYRFVKKLIGRGNFPAIYVSISNITAPECLGSIRQVRSQTSKEA
jgi:hypothetical protein